MIKLTRIIINCDVEVNNHDELEALKEEMKQVWKEASIYFNYTDYDDITNLTNNEKDGKK